MPRARNIVMCVLVVTLTAMVYLSANVARARLTTLQNHPLTCAAEDVAMGVCENISR